MSRPGYRSSPGLTNLHRLGSRPDRWLVDLVSISRRIANMDHVDATLGAIVDLARRLLHSDIAVIGLWSGARSRLELQCYATAEGVGSGDHQEIEADEIVTAVCSGRLTAVLPSQTAQSESWHCPILHRQIMAAVIVPLQIGGKTIGGVWVGRCAATPYSRELIEVLERLGDQAVIALEHAAMAAQIQSLAVIEERSRIAREMHDSLAQILGYLGLQTQTLEAFILQGNTVQALEELRQARACIAAAQADVRENILSLRTTLAHEAGLVSALHEYVEEFGLQSGVDARLRADTPGPLPLSPLAETQLVRVVQEALTNVRKHAQASHVDVRLSVEGTQLCVSIVDNGIGFEARPAAGHTFGLQTMRERVESVGGALLVTSAPGEGTQVELSLPLQVC